MMRDILARRMFAPDIDAMRHSLPDVGESLSNACLELERELTLERLDELLNRFSAAQQNLVHLRKALAIEQGGVHRGGTG